MRVRSLLAVSALALLVGAASAQAAEEVEEANEVSDLARIGPYVSLGPSWVWRNDDAGGETVGANGRVGFRVWKHLAVEVEGEYHASHSQGWTAGGNLKYLPLVGSLQPFLLLGGVYWDVGRDSNQGEDSGGGLRVGGGLDGHITEHFYLTGGVEYVWGLGELDSFNFATLYVGAGFRL